MKKLLLVLAVAAVAVPAASAGGWATVGLSSLPPSGLEANQAWPVDITVLQHGQTPLAGVDTDRPDPQRQRQRRQDLYGAADRQDRRLPRRRHLPGRRHVLVRGLRRFHPVRRREDAHVQAGRDRRARRLVPVSPARTGSRARPRSRAGTIVYLRRGRREPATVTDLREAA